MQGRAVTSEQVERLLDNLRLGMTRRAAAGSAGFSRATFYRMIADETLLTLVEKAEDQAEGGHTTVVAQAAPKNWQASAWWLERRRPDDFGRKDRVEVKVDLRHIAEKVAPDVDLDAVIAEAERIMSEAR